MRRWVVVAVMAAVTGCGDNIPVGWESGPRMRAHVLTASDGLAILDGWYDRGLDEYCGWPGEGEACGAKRTTGLYYRDAACTRPVIWPASEALPNPPFVIAHDTRDDVDRSYALEPTTYHGESYAYGPTVGCVSIGILDANDAHEVDLPAATLERLEQGRVVVRRWPDNAFWSYGEGDHAHPDTHLTTRLRTLVVNGVWSPGPLYDSMRDEMCVPHLAGSTFRCLPTPAFWIDAADAPVFRDPACTEPADGVINGGPPLIITRDSQPVSVLYPTADPAPGPLYDWGGFFGSCSLVTTEVLAAQHVEISAYEELTAAIE